MATKETSTEDETRDTEKAVSREELKAVVKAMTDGFKSIFNVLGKAMDTDAKDQVNPDEDKDEPEKVTAKMDGEALDQANPDKEKPEDESPTAKAREGQETHGSETEGSDTTGEREKSETAETETATKTKTKASSKDTSEDTYDLKTVKAMTKSFEELGFRLSKATETETEETKTKTKAESSSSETEEEKTKAEETDETSSTKKAMHPLDKLVLTMAKTMMAMAESMEKTGMRIPGFEREFMAKYQNDPVFQKSVSELMQVPGFKKSVSMGMAYVPTKDGGRIPLSLTPASATTVEKSISSKGENFTDLYKKEFSSVSHLDES